MLDRSEFMQDGERSERERLSAAPDLDAGLAELLPDFLPTLEPSAAGRARLLGAAESPALRYAPFYGQLAQLWDLTDAQLEAVFTAAERGKGWHWVWPGFRFHSVEAGPRLGDARARLLHFAPGVRFPRHRHRGSESILVLAGSYTDSNAIEVRAGDQQEMSAGSEHELRIGRAGPCLAAVVERGLEFENPVLKRLGRWLSL